MFHFAKVISKQNSYVQLWGKTLFAQVRNVIVAHFGGNLSPLIEVNDHYLKLNMFSDVLPCLRMRIQIIYHFSLFKCNAWVCKIRSDLAASDQ